MGGTLTRHEWLKVREGADTPPRSRQHRNPARLPNVGGRASRGLLGCLEDLERETLT